MIAYYTPGALSSAGLKMYYEAKINTLFFLVLHVLARLARNSHGRIGRLLQEGPGRCLHYSTMLRLAHGSIAYKVHSVLLA